MTAQGGSRLALIEAVTRAVNVPRCIRNPDATRDVLVQPLEADECDEDRTMSVAKDEKR